MPRKIRELKAQITREGFVYLPKRGKGSHERWRHPILQKTLTISGKNGDLTFHGKSSSPEKAWLFPQANSQ